MTDVAIVGIGIHKFGRTDGVSGLQQGAEAARRAMEQAGIAWDDIQFAYGGSSAAGNADNLVNELGLTGLPFINVSNGCATGGSALISAYSAIKSGQFDVGMAVGFDKHPRGAFQVKPKEWGLGEWYGENGFALTTQFFGMKIMRYMHDYGITEDSLVRVAQKAYENGSRTPTAWRREPVSYEESAKAQMLNDRLRKFMFCSPSEGGVALILCRADQAHRYTDKPVYLRSATVRTRRYGSFEVFAPWKAIEDNPGPTVEASKAAFEMAGIAPEEIDVAQLQDTESGAEVMHMAETGLCAHGEQERLLSEGATRLDGAMPINTDGGCLANGEPIGASGLRQVHEIVVQLRGEGGERQVPKQPKTGFTHVYGAPGLSACTVLSV